MKMKRHYGIKALFLMLLSAIGLTSCDFILNLLPIPKCMYGTPSADYKISGKIKDESGNGINQVRVVVGSAQKNTSSVIYDYPFIPYDTLYTDSKGNYSFVREREFPAATLRIIAEDVDGDENGGTFLKDSLDIKMKYTGGDDSWYSGKAVLDNQDITLKKEK